MGISSSRGPPEWADPEVATEFGAYAVALLLAGELDRLSMVTRARRGGGFDFLLRAEGSRTQDASTFLTGGLVRLEVSGIREGSLQHISQRRRQKQRRLMNYRESGAWIVTIGEFSKPRAAIEIGT